MGDFVKSVATHDAVIDDLATNLQGKMVVSLDTVDWEEAGKNLKFAILIRFASGRTVQKKPIEELLIKVWKTELLVTFWIVDRGILLVSFGSEEKQLKVLTGSPWSFERNALVKEKWVS